MENNTVKTYIQIAEELFAKDPGFYDEMTAHNAMLSLAKYLDSFQEMTASLYITALESNVALQKEYIHALADCVGFEKAKEVISAVSKKHRHSKKVVKPSDTALS